MAKRTAKKRKKGRRRDEHLSNGSVIYWSRRFKDGKGHYRVPVRCGRCGQVRKICASRAYSEDFTSLCRTCAYLAQAFYIPRSTLEQLYCEEHLSQSEIAERLGCSETVVRKRLCLQRKRAVWEAYISQSATGQYACAASRNEVK